MQIVSAAETVSIVQSGNRVFFAGCTMTPNFFIDALCERYDELSDLMEVKHHKIWRDQKIKLNS